jgi:hypothetical protein
LGVTKETKLTSFFFLFPYWVQWVQTQWARLSVTCMDGGWVTMVVVVVIVTIRACGGQDLAGMGLDV